MKNQSNVCCSFCEGYDVEENHHWCSAPMCKCHSNQDTSLSKETLIEDAVKEIESKITDHVFDGSCCYNDNEGGKGHAECRYPYNPGRENPSEKQCLKLKSEHKDLRQTFSDLYDKAHAAGREEANSEVSSLVGEDGKLFSKVVSMASQAPFPEVAMQHAIRRVHERAFTMGAQSMKERILAAIADNRTDIWDAFTVSTIRALIESII
jgi:hypothetical protein